MNYIYCLVGISGSGKTTLAREMIKYLDAVIISRDQLRKHLFGYTEETVHNYYQLDDVARREKIVTKHQDRLIQSVLDDGIDVILDNTHLKLSYINELKKFGVPIRFTLVDTDFETALERDQARVRHVGEDVIRRQFEQLEHLKKVFDRSEERRVGKECRSRWSPYRKNKKDEMGKLGQPNMPDYKKQRT